MRCKGCNKILSMFENRLKKKDGTPEDLCSTCRRYSNPDCFQEKPEDNVKYIRDDIDDLH